MNFLANSYNALLGDKAEQPSVDITIDKLCDRFRHATLLDDRRGALKALKGLSKDYPLLVGTKGLDLFIKALQSSDMEDLDMSKAVIEALNYVCSDTDQGLQFSEMVVKDASNVSLIVNMLDAADFHVRYDTIQFMSLLLKQKPEELQEGLIIAPMGVSKLVDLLDAENEVLRNEGILLLISLTESNAEIQKIIAFENTFERCLEIIFEQGSLKGDIVVQDCLQLMINLLHYNVSNQNYFRETACINKLVHLFDNLETEEKKTRQMINNFKKALQLIRILVFPDSQSTNLNQNCLYSSQALFKITHFLLSQTDFDESVKTSAIYTVADMIRGFEKNQEYIFNLNTENESALLFFGRNLYTRVDHLPIRLASVYLIELKNLDNQETLPNLILHTLLDWQNSRKDSYRVLFSSFFIRSLFNEEHKSYAPEFMIPTVKYGEKTEISLIESITEQLIASSRENNVNQRIPIAYLELLCYLAFESPKSISLVFNESYRLQFFIELISQSTGVDNIVQGLAALLLGISYEFTDDSKIKKSDLLPIVTTRIGLDLFFSRLKRISDSPFFQVSKTLEMPENSEIYFDNSFVDFFKRASIVVHDAFSKKKSSKPQSNQDKEIQSLKLKIEKLESEKQEKEVQFTKKIEELENTIKSLSENVEKLLVQLKTKETELLNEKEQFNDLLACVGEQEQEVKFYKSKLKEYGEVFPESDDEEKQEEK
ncbi:Vesicle tethering protein Uso1/P115-like, head domain-containing protein [Rozella allomycis CSF55]|uniref:Vesicle tethering protein Uso1/P115-like, head domain-containing protein n=1 Tax=Rozella allomycis (strain CSF55) TaxID=988480 RepID=A0A075AMU8_ROZAC|nr:Vesicle tethering protein Uso1/P115-like, head domain-containing protein [Rozella allomycis CSF55]|eukprot:EPZ31021.1 Vesicle tethering protein Uso1/P115-like, head domain-containing protein [Rozella allomycis CSF55]